MKLALIQLTTGDESGRVAEEVADKIRSAARQGGELICTPETTHLMEMNRQRVLEKARFEDEDPGLELFTALARELKVWLHIGSLIIKASDETLVNRSFLINSAGAIVARYTKLHLFDVDLGGGEIYRESALYQAGENGVIAATPWAKLGLSICYDLRFPELFQRYASEGAQILMVPSAFTKPTGEAHWHALLRARAIETGSFVVAAAQTGLHATGRETFGHSLVVDPWGKVILDAGQDTGVHLVDIDLDMVDIARRKLPNLRHRRSFDILHS